jgi:CubicO group peptidase (beta-lactamase class C family)
MRHSSDPHILRASMTSAAVAVLLSAGCYRAPTLTGDDQVYDPNIEATVLKDNDLAALSWPVVDGYMRSFLPDRNAPGCAVGIARGGEVIYLRGYGKAVIGGAEWGVGTMGAVGSVSKTFTAAAMLRMHELGLLSVNHSVGAYLPTSNGALSGTMLARLLAHSSGVGGATQGAAFSHDWEVPSPADDCLWNSDSECDLVRWLAAEPEIAFDWYEASEAVANLADGNPGMGVPDQGVYSNVGYSVAGAVIDAVAGDTPSGGYEAWLWDNVGQYTGSLLDADNLLTLALTHSWRDTDIPNRAVGYIQNGPGFDVVEAFDAGSVGGLEGWEGPSGGWVMTIGDLTRFAVALNTEQIVGPALLAAMRFDWSDLDGFGDDYGMGVFLTPQNTARPPVWHGGTIGGHNAMWGWWDSFGSSGQSIGIAMICNRNISPFTLAGDAVDLASLIQGSSPTPPAFAPRVRVDRRRLRGETFALDLSKAWQSEPRGVVTPLSMKHDLFLEARAVRRGLELTLSEGERGSGAPSIGRSYALGTARAFHNPRFASRRTDVELTTRFGEITVHELEIEGALADGGKALAEVSLSGVLDLRQQRRAGPRAIAGTCGDLRRAGASCRRCPDGVAACVAVRFEGIEARALSD